jgi:molybdopterin/thiamine biosynthesis adenylyltransferase
VSRSPLPAPRLPAGACVKLVGLGGVGGIVARYLVLFLRALDAPCRLVLIDGDSFEPRNAARMAFAEAGNKAQGVADELLPLVEGSRLLLSAVPEFVTPQNLPRLLREGDVVLLAVDNHATRKLVSDHVGRLEDALLLSCGNDGVGADSTGAVRAGTYGNVQAYLRRAGRDSSPSLGRYHPEIEQPADRRPDELDCIAAISSTPQILFANLQAASALLSTLLLHLCGELTYGELGFDIRAARMAPSLLPGPA